jgi:hypothetical protein
LFKCEFSGCSNIFLKKRSLKNHIVTHSNLRIYNCSERECLKSFKTQQALSRHRTTHLRKYTYIYIFSKLPCPLCKKDLASSFSLKSHLKRKHLFKRRFNCKICWKFFDSVQERNFHIYFLHNKHDIFGVNKDEVF